MSIFDYIRNKTKDAFGVVYVEENAGIITIGGINTEKLLEDINKIWGNVRVVKIIFTGLNKNNVSFYRFFGIDVLYIFQMVWEFKRATSGKFRIRHAIEQLQTNTWLRQLNHDYPSILNYDRLKLLFHTPYEHQMKFLEMYDQKTQRMHLDGFLLAADPGAGKTISSIALSVCLEVDVVIVVPPKGLADTVWTHDVKEELGENISMWSSTENVPLKTGYKWYVFHFDAIGKAFEIVDWLKTKKTCIVLDESHNFNDANAVRSLRFIELCHRIKCHNVIFSSGTPVKALGYEVITLLRCIDPLFTPEVEILFRKIFGVSSKRAVDILRHRIGLIGHKIPREVFMKVAPPIVKDLKVKLPNGKKYTVENAKIAMRAYIVDRKKYYAEHFRDYVKTFDDCVNAYARTVKTDKDRNDLNKYMSYVSEIRKGFDPKAHKDMAKYCRSYEKQKINPVLNSSQKKAFEDASSVIKYVQLKILGEALSRVLGKLRSECACEMIPYAKLIDIVKEADKKTLCFTTFVDVIKTADEYFKSFGLVPTLVYGETNKEIAPIISKFKSDPNINPIIATLQSMSAGVTLVNCSICIMLNMPWRDYLWQQAIARIFRIGQNSQTYIIQVILDTGNEPNISTRAKDIMEWSRAQVELIMGKGVNDAQMDSIIKRLHMNPISKLEKVLHIFHDLFR